MLAAVLVSGDVSAAANRATPASRLLLGDTCSAVPQEAAQRFLDAWLSRPQPGRPAALPTVRFCGHTLPPLEAAPMPMTVVHTLSLSLLPSLKPVPFLSKPLRWRYAGLVRATLTGTATVKPAFKATATPTAASASTSGATRTPERIAPTTWIVTVTASTLRVRSGPGTTYSVVGRVHKGDKLLVEKRSGQWLQVRFHGGTAWVHGGYVK